MILKNIEVDEFNPEGLSDAKYFFRGIILHQSNISFSQLEGFKRRYPKAWLNRESYPFYNHSSIRDISLKGEYRFNLCYCLIEFSRENEGLAKELKPFFLSRDKKLLKVFKEAKNDPKPIENGMELILSQYGYSMFDWEGCLMVAFVDYLMEEYKIPYPTSLKTVYCNKFNSSTKFFLLAYEQKSVLKIRPFTEAIYSKKGKIYQTLQEYYKRYSDYVGKPMIQHLKDCLDFGEDIRDYDGSEATKSLLLVNHLFGLKYSPTGNEPLFSVAEVYEMLAAMLFYNGFTPDQVMDTSKETFTQKKWDELIVFCDENLVMYATEYLLAREHEQNRNLFFKLTDTSDLISLKQLEKENKEQKHLLRDEKRNIKELEKQLTMLKNNQDKKMKEALKEQHRNLIETNRLLAKQQEENRELISELNELKEITQLLQTQLTEQTKHLQSKSSTNLLEEAKDKLNQPSVLFVGGHPNTISKLKKILPSCKFFEVDKTYDAQFSKNIKQIFIFADYVNHGMVYHLNKFIEAPKRILVGNNVDYILNQCLEFDKNH